MNENYSANVQSLTRHHVCDPDHLGVIVDEQLSHTALSVHQEAISPPFLGQRGLVTRGNQSVQLPLATAHQLDKLRNESEEYVARSDPRRGKALVHIVRRAERTG